MEMTQAFIWNRLFRDNSAAADQSLCTQEFPTAAATEAPDVFGSGISGSGDIGFAPYLPSQRRW
jgi:hypothetical protein